MHFDHIQETCKEFYAMPFIMLYNRSIEHYLGFASSMKKVKTSLLMTES